MKRREFIKLGLAASLLAGLAMVNLFQVAPEAIFEVSTKRVAYVLPIIGKGVDAGVSSGTRKEAADA